MSVRFLRLPPVLLVLLGLVACADGVTTPSIDEGLHEVARALVDASDPASLVPGFYFLPPTVPGPPPAFSGSFDPDLEPVVEICALSGGDPASPADCTVPPLASLTARGAPPSLAQGKGSEGSYRATWKSTLQPGVAYRAFVRVGSTVLGYVDLWGIAPGGDPAPDGFVAVVQRRAFTFRFRVETGIVGSVLVTPPAASIFDAGTEGASQLFTATVLDLHSDPLPGVTVDWGVSDGSLVSLSPSSGSTDGSGQVSTAATPSELVFGPTDVEVTATAQGTSGLAVLTVEPSPGRPLGQPDVYGVLQGETLTVPAPGVLANDVDLEGDAISVSSVSDGVDHGTLSLQPDGSFSYTPDGGFLGTDGFSYVAMDASGNPSHPVEVTLEVLEPSKLGPVATPDHYVVVEGNALSIAAPGFLANDVDGNGQALSGVAIVDSPDNGTVVAFPDGSFTYTPGAGFVGTDAFTYRAADPDLNTDEATVTIEVLPDPDKSPVAVDDRFVVVEGNVLSIPAAGFLDNDLDPDGQPISGVAVVDSPDNGTLVAFPDGSFTYTPAAGFVGTDAFSYRMRDADLNTDEATVTVEVLPASTLLPVATDDDYAVVEGNALQVVAAGFLLNDLDPDGQPISGVAIVDSPDNGTVVAFPDGSFTYTPAAGFVGTDAFSYRMRDADLNTDEATVTIEVLPDPDKNPVATDDVYTMVEGTALNAAAPGFLANDLDPDGAAVTGVAIVDSPDNGTVVAFPDGSFTYTPAAGFVGTDAFSYRMRDADLNTDEATVTIQVLPDPNQPPVPLADFYATPAGVALSVTAPGFIGNDVDREGEAVTASAIVDSPDNGTLVAFPDGSFTYTPADGFIGTDQFEYRVRDASLNSADGGVVTVEVLDPALAAALVASAEDGEGPPPVRAVGERPLGLEPEEESVPISPSTVGTEIVTPEGRGDALPTGRGGAITVPYEPTYRIDPAEFGAGKRPLAGGGAPDY